jgi:cytochrome c
VRATFPAAGASVTGPEDKVGEDVRMSSADFNKFVGAILVSLLAAVAIGIFVNETMHPHMMSADEMAYKVETAGGEAGAAGAAAEEPALEPVAPLLAAASAADGEKLSKRCANCHSFDKGGVNKVGPNLYGTIGHDMAAHADFSYSAALSKKGGTWDYAALNEFLANPKAYLPGTKMSFPGLKNVKDRAAIMAYLRQQSDNPPPLP